MSAKKKMGIIEFGQKIKRTFEKISGETANFKDEICKGKIKGKSCVVTWPVSESHSMVAAIEGRANYEIITAFSKIFGLLPYCSYYFEDSIIYEWSTDPTAKHKIPQKGHAIDLKKIDINNFEAKP